MVTHSVSSAAELSQLTELRLALAAVLERGSTGRLLPASNGESAIERQALDLVAATRRWFPPGPLAVSEEYDPEDRANVFLVIDVQAAGDFAEIERLRTHWQEDACRIIAGDCSWLRLCIYPR